MAFEIQMRDMIVPPHRPALRRDVIASASKDEAPKARSDQQEKCDLVITPGGPRPRDQVHRVGPNEVVRHNPDGSYTVEPRERDHRLPKK